MKRPDFATWASQCTTCGHCHALIPPAAPRCPVCEREPRRGARLDALRTAATDVLDALCELAVREPVTLEVAAAMLDAFEALSYAIDLLARGDSDAARGRARLGARCLREVVCIAEASLEEVAA